MSHEILLRALVERFGAGAFRSGTYRWSGPGPVWQAVPHILRRGRIRDERDHSILTGALQAETLDEEEREAVKALLAEYDVSTEEQG